MRELKFRVYTEIAFEILGMKFFDLKDATGYNDTVMQYTGMKDKNDVEIYEGDIVNCLAKDNFKEDEGMCEIYFGTGYGFCLRKRDNLFGLPINWGGYTSIEVTGNIYQNPELLK